MLQVTPSSSSGRREFSIQPAYFTSNLFVDSLREDILQLILSYNEAYYAAQQSSAMPLKPFALFKDIWQRLGWNLLHLKVLESRARDTFVNVVFRLFLERTVEMENIMCRVVGIFGIYTFYMSQPSTSTVPLHNVSGIPISIDHYESLLLIPLLLEFTLDLEALRPHILYIMHTLFTSSAFLIIPSLPLCPHNPRELPREVFHSPDTEPSGTSRDQKKMGRPSRAEKTQKAKAALIGLNRWLEKTDHPFVASSTDSSSQMNVSPLPVEEQAQGSSTHGFSSQQSRTALDVYKEKKNILLSAVDGKLTARASLIVAHRLKQLNEQLENENPGISNEDGRAGLERAIRVVREMGSDGKGLLGLLDGAGLTEADSKWPR